MKYKPPPKRAKLDAASPGSFRLSPSTDVRPPVDRRDVVIPLINKSAVRNAQTSSINIRIQQARDSAVAEAQRDGCTGNYRIFDSPFGNYLVPVLPTRAELGG